MKTHLIAVLLSCFALIPLIASAQTESQRPDAFAFANVSKGVECHFVKELTALPEWKPFVDALTNKIDAEYEKATHKHDFPTPMAETFLNKVREATGKSDITSRDVLKLAIKNWEGTLLNVWLTGNDEKPFEGAVAFVVKFDPKELGDIFAHIPGFMYNILKNEDSEKLYYFRHENNEVYLGYTKASSGYYVISASDKRNRIEQLLAAKQDFRFDIKDNSDSVTIKSRPIKEISLPSEFFEKARGFLVEKAKEQAGSNPDLENIITILENIDNIRYTLEDEGYVTNAGNDKNRIGGSTTAKLSLTMKEAQEAKNVKELAEGGIALLTMIATFNTDIDEFGKQLIGLVTQIKIEQTDKTVTASCRSDAPQLKTILKAILAKATEELKK